MKKYLEMPEAHWLQCLVNSIRNLYNPQPNEREKDFFKKKDTYLRYEKILQEEFSYHSTLSDVFLSEDVFEKIQYQYKLNFELQRDGRNGEPCYENLSKWSKKGKGKIIKLALQSQGIGYEKLFPPSLLKKSIVFFKKLLKITEI